MSHIDKKKFDKLKQGQSFEYKDIAMEDLPINKHDQDGVVFKGEVESGKYDNIKISNGRTEPVTYKKI